MRPYPLQLFGHKSPQNYCDVRLDRSDVDDLSLVAQCTKAQPLTADGPTIVANVLLKARQRNGLFAARGG